MLLARRSILVVTAAFVAAATLFPVTAGAALRANWRRDLGREIRAVAVDEHGNAYVTGYVRAGARRLRTMFVARFAADGTRRWIDTWRPQADAQTVGNDVAVGRDGRVFVAGAISGTDDAPSGWVLRAYGPGGSVRWHRDDHGWRQRTRRAAALGVDVGGDLVAIAVTAEGRNGYREGSIRAYGTDGALRWTDPFEVSGFSTYDRVTDIAVGSRGAVYAVGGLDQKRVTADRPKVDEEIVVQRLEAATGDIRWILMMRDRNVRDADVATAVAVRGDVLAIGARIDGGPVAGPRAQRGHTWVARIRAGDATLLWQREWGEGNRKAAEPDDVAIGPGGTVRVAGTIRGSSHGVDAFLRSFTATGDRAGWLRLRSGRFLHGSGVATAANGGRVWLSAWRGTRDGDRPAGGHLWMLRPSG